MVCLSAKLIDLQSQIFMTFSAAKEAYMLERGEQLDVPCEFLRGTGQHVYIL